MLRGNAGKAARGLDFNPSGPEVAWGLLGAEYERLSSFERIWEPACGDGALVKPLRAAGLRVAASDIVDRGCPAAWVQDYLGAAARWDPVRAIITNPPFDLAQAFIARSLDASPFVAMFLRVQFLEGGKRNPWLQDSGLSRVCVFVERLQMMHREGYAGRKLKKSPGCFAWFIWDADATNEWPQVRWITADTIARGRALSERLAA